MTREDSTSGGSDLTRRDILALTALGGVAGVAQPSLAAARGSAFAAGLPEGQLTWGIHVSLAPTWFDPAETPGIITPPLWSSMRCMTAW